MDSSQTNQTDPIRHWTSRLVREYDHILYMYKVKLARPVLRLFDLTSRWGEWDPQTRIISLSRHLVERYSWEVVIEILKHEMAHQMVSEFFKVEEGHGPTFRRACQMLGMAPWAMRAEAECDDLDKMRDLSEDAPEDRILNRIRKLLALAGSSNEHESALAMKKVQELYARHNLEQLTNLESEAGRKLVYLILKLRKKRVERFQSAIATLLHDFFFVQVIHAGLYDAHDCKEYKTIELLGTSEAVKMAEHVYWYLDRHVKSLWHDFRKKTGKGLRSRNSYLLGVLAGLRSQLEENARQNRTEWDSKVTSTGKSVVAVAEAELEDFLNYRYPKTVKFGNRKALSDGHSYRAGESEGKKLRIHKPISESQKTSQLLR